MDQQQLALSPYRVLDLTEGECLLGGRMMGDLGADVIQIEKPGGSPSRNRGPFYKDIPDPEKSLFWFGFCLNKRSITLDIETADGQNLFRRLVASAHFIFESFEPGYLDSLGLGYQALSQINPGIILASITPFGQTGPKAHYKGAELIGWASSGTLHASGDSDRTPSVLAVPVAGQQAALAAVLGAMTAHWHRRITGEGQHVDVSIQEVMEWSTLHGIQWWDCQHTELPRVGWGLPIGPRTFMPNGFPCKDGYASFQLSSAALWLLKATRELYKWIEEEGMLPDWLKDYDWASFDLSKFKEQKELVRYLEPAKNLYLNKTKAELWQVALKRRTQTSPVRDFKDNFEDPHLRDRGFWVDIKHPELNNDVITYPGSCLKMSKSPGRFRKAPLIGEHNQDIYEGELGLSRQQMTSLGPTELFDVKKRRKDSEAMASRKPLEGIKIIDLGSVALEPVNCKHLADYGATVVRVESHRSPDVVRFTQPYYKHHLDGGMFFANCNSSKLSVTIDLEQPTGMDILWRLIKWADVLACGRPGEWMDKWGLDYENVKKVKPDIVYYITSILGIFGRDCGLFGTGILSNSLIGVQHLTGWPDRGPSNPAGVMGDSLNYLYGAIGILAALEQRERTGEGQLIDHSHIETFLWSESPWLLDYAVNGRVATRSGNRYPLFADNVPYGAFPCKERNGRDRWVAICVTNDKEWQAFCEVIGQPEWTKETRFATAWGRRQNEDELEKLVSEWTKNQTAEEVETLMQAEGVPASAVESNKDVFEDPHLKERGYIRWLKHKELGVVPFSGPPFRLTKTPDAQFASPCMGEHSEYILRELLGMSEEEVNKAIVERGVTTEYDLPVMGRQ